MTKDHVIGINGRLPWQIPEDLLLFRDLTLGNTVIMGAKTFQSIGKPLVGRNNIVLTSSPTAVGGALSCDSFVSGLLKAWRIGRPIYIIGGESLYRKSLSIADSLHISWIKGKFAGDCYFPDFDIQEWEPVEKKAFEAFDYVHYQRRSM